MSGANTVWLASYPKSGNTWFRAVYAAWQRGDPLDFNGAEGMPAFRGRFDDALGLRSSDLTLDEANRLRPLADDVTDALQREPHLHKVHDSLWSGPDGSLIVSAAATRCAVYVLRDPRDVAVSFAHHNGREVAWAVERLCAADTWIRARRDDVFAQLPQRLGSWSEHVSGWVDGAPFPVTVVRYEDCLADPVAAFGKALRFAGVTVADDELAVAVDAASFARLQQREQAAGFKERWNRDVPFFRRGRAGGWRDELAPELAQRIERAHGALMRRFGYLDGDETADATVSSKATIDSSA